MLILFLFSGKAKNNNAINSSDQIQTTDEATEILPESDYIMVNDPI